jgi:two-component system, cell cycle sensor histidine kinase and response regulator CckA
MSEPQTSQEALRESEERFRGAFQYSPVGMGIVALDGRFVRVNPALCRIGGYTADELLSRKFQDVVPAEELDIHREEVRRLLRGEIESYEHEVRYRHKLGHDVWVRFTVSPIRGADGEVVHLLGQAEDISARREAERRLRQAERLEAVGRLAGGIAHEFNNLLAVIGGFARHALEVTSAEPLRRDLSEIVDATNRATDIARQLLAFSRDEASHPSVLDVNDVVRGVEPMLRSLIREDIELVAAVADEPCVVRVDRMQLERVIVNLVVNARDAIRGPGRIDIATRVLAPEEAPKAQPQLPRGSCVALSVSDTGSGIAADARPHLFDPFFTTKEQGEGTGLGLSIVYGIVEQFGGAVDVQSEPGHGATFAVYLPCSAEAPERPGDVQRAGAAPTQPPPPGGVETVLVVEDEEALRSLIELILTEAGYRVLAAANGEEALKLLRSRDPIDLVLTDSIMPRVSGSELVRRLRAIRPEARVIQMTGYRELGAPKDEFLAKPFEPETLLQSIREVLDRPPPGG